MSLDSRVVRDDWQRRQQEHGNAPRAVLMKGLHPLVNASIDAWHRDVLRAVLRSDAAPPPGSCVLDLGCGFGRLADEVTKAGRTPIGIDFTSGFCSGFAAAHGIAVCGDQTALPFADGAFDAAYSVTSLMYLKGEAVRRALAELDRCLAPGGLLLVLEPCLEFNELVRALLPRKRSERLAMPGFAVGELQALLPPGWQPVAAGHCRWLTLALPMLVLATRWPSLYRWIAGMALRLDRPRINGRGAHGRLAMYRWTACRKDR